MRKKTTQTKTTNYAKAEVDSSGNKTWKLKRNLLLGKFTKDDFYKCAVIDKNGIPKHYKLNKNYDFEEAVEKALEHYAKVRGLKTKKKKAQRKTTETAKQQLTLADRTICNGNVVLFERANTRKWQAKIKRITGTWKDYTTKTDDFEEAKANAEELYRDIKYRQETGKVDITKRFKDVCEVAHKQLTEEYERTGRQQVKDKARVIKQYLIPLLGSYNTHSIDNNVLVEFSEKREKLMGKKPAKSTLNTQNSALNYCFALAKAKNYIVELPQVVNDGADEYKRRVYFEHEEYMALCRFMWRDLKASEKLLTIKNGRNGIDTITQTTYEIRELLRDVVLILANTGIRTGNELLRIKWNNIEIKEDSIVFYLTKTKTQRHREVVAYEPKTKGEKRYGVWSCLERIQQRFTELENMDFEELFAQNEYVFRLPTSKKVVRQEALAKNFKKLLMRCEYKGRKEGLLRNKSGEVRVLYSLRHTYASRRRFEGMSFDDLATVMGTSVKFLEAVYSHFKVSDKPQAYSGAEKRKKQEKEESAEARMISMEKNIEKQTEQIAKLLAQNEKLTEQLLQTKH